MNILGINAFHGDASSVLVSDGELVAALEEERFTRIKHCAGFPTRSIRACLDVAGLEPQDIDHFAVSRDPAAHRARRFAYALRRRPSFGLVIDRLRNRANVSDVADALGDALGVSSSHVSSRLHFVEHHPAHLASAFLVSPFEDAAVCAIDGFGDFVSTSMAQGVGRRVNVIDRVFFPHSLGLLYLAITQWLGFPSYGDEYKVMGLAPYGEPELADEMRGLVHLEPGGKFSLSLRYFRHASESVAMTWDEGAPEIGPVFSPELEALLGPARKPDEPLTARHEAVAASLQLVFEEGVFHVLRALHERTGNPRLCLAGGCAMNSVANGKIRDNTPFTDVFIQPAAGDDGTALGAAFHVWNDVLRRPRRFVMHHGSWGPAYDASRCAAAIEARASALDGVYPARELEDPQELVEWTAERLAAGNVVGWFQGRMEWGARALGNRSILADPRRPDMRDILNTKIKLREKFRPFAPAVIEERARDYFDGAVADPFMLHVFPVAVAQRDTLPAVTHVDGTGRVQTVSARDNPLFHRLLQAFDRLTGVPVLINTSFNENEPIVNEPAEALDCFLRTGMDVLVLGNYILEKRATHDSLETEGNKAVALAGRA
jgi:carbamoyltransferase